MPKEWRNIMLSTGEASISNMADEKAGVSARVVTLQDRPYPDNFDFTTLDKAFRENYGTLGVAFIKQYKSKKRHTRVHLKVINGTLIKKVVMKSCNV